MPDDTPPRPAPPQETADAPAAGAWRALRARAGHLRDALMHRHALLREALRESGEVIAPRRARLRRAAAAAVRRRDLSAALAVLEGDADSAWLAWLGQACRRAGRRADAARLLDRALALDPQRVAAWRALATCGIGQAPPGLLPAAFVHHHLGLGDHILCHALVVHLAEPHESVGLFVKRAYLESVRFMYRDEPRLRFFAVRDDREVAAFLRAWPQRPCIRIGFEQLDIRGRSFAESFYRQAGLDYALRWNSAVRRDPQRERALQRALGGPAGPYVFLHDDPARGYVIDHRRLPQGLPIVRPRPGLTDNIFDYALVMERAQEIHCMDSSFRHVVDTLGLAGPRLFLHLYAKGVDVPSRLPWTVLA